MRQEEISAICLISAAHVVLRRRRQLLEPEEGPFLSARVGVEVVLAASSVPEPTEVDGLATVGRMSQLMPSGAR